MADHGADPGGHTGANIASGSGRHIPVLRDEVLAALRPADGETYIDGTFGAGGYSCAILAAAGCRLLAIDRDPDAIAAGQHLTKKFGGRLELAPGRFSQMALIAAAAGITSVDGVVLDIGMSSMQLDQAARGFSFQRSGPLDMRMSQTGPSAADIVNGAEETLIADILYNLGGERRSRAIARAIVKARAAEPLTRTAALAALVAGVLGRRKSDTKHPATRTFQALRIYVNDELGELAAAMHAGEALLKPGGRLAVVTFHSLEDAMVKHFFSARTGTAGRASRHLPFDESKQRRPSFQFVNRRPVSPSKVELGANPRARSARMRWALRTQAPAWPFDGSIIVGPRPGN